jgi:GT2 family glycosyltransferase
MNWSLVISTYNRPDALRRCLELATSQSRPPAEVVIVDASNDWETHRRMALHEVAPRAPTGICWRYEPARVRGLPSQRNQAIALATGDVLFLIDDDSYMYQDCAHEVMKIYEADARGCVAGVAMIGADRLPEPSDRLAGAAAVDAQAPTTEARSRSVAERLSQFIAKELAVEGLLLPYDETYPDQPVPPELAGAAVAPTRFIGGCRMTFRAPIIRDVGFDETLKRYAAAEDIDASYRASRRGVLLNAFKARVFHAQDATARLSRHTCTLLLLLNLAYLYRRKGYDPARVLGRYRWRVLRRLAVDIVRDAARKRFSLPYARADLKALLRLGAIGRIPVEDIVDWYEAFQERIIAQNAA